MQLSLGSALPTFLWDVGEHLCGVSVWKADLCLGSIGSFFGFVCISTIYTKKRAEFLKGGGVLTKKQGFFPFHFSFSKLFFFHLLFLRHRNLGMVLD